MLCTTAMHAVHFSFPALSLAICHIACCALVPLSVDPRLLLLLLLVVVSTHRELPASADQVWFEAAEGAYRWRQTASTVLLQLHAIPDTITSAKQLSVSIGAQHLRVEQQGSGELLFEAQLSRSIIPQDSSWEFVKSDDNNSRPAASSSSSSSGGAGRLGLAPAGGDVQHLLLASAGCAATAQLVSSSSPGSSSSSSHHILFDLAKMNLELYAR